MVVLRQFSTINTDYFCHKYFLPWANLSIAMGLFGNSGSGNLNLGKNLRFFFFLLTPIKSYDTIKEISLEKLLSFLLDK
ncbi:MAG: hypothetical protein LBG08_04145, partial [Spirochaetaceae bacterium]|nr:hypothetical protein [Spirochaetaceae bacterium]